MFNRYSLSKRLVGQSVLLPVCLIVVGLCYANFSLAEVKRESLQDPTRPLHYQPAGVANNTLVLNSILHSADRKQAVINGKAVREAGFVAGAQVLRINVDSVEVNLGGKRQILTLRQQAIKTPSAK